MAKQMVRDRILKLYQERQNSGALPTVQQMEEYYRLFRQKFGPDILLGLDGEPLLNLMHDFGTHNSLVYWLEFKNEPEFPAIFGSIAGGSAKVQIFRRKETGAWTTGTPQKSYEISVDEAVEIARRHRDQLLKGVAIIQEMADSTSNSAYFQFSRT